MIKAIETRYAGCHFRSRIEARWAVFLDHMGIEWQYEPEGFDLPAGRYLPDFHLPSLKTWLEIKGRSPDAHEVVLAQQLEGETGERVIILNGDIPRTAQGHHWLGPAEASCQEALDAARAARFEHGQKPEPAAPNAFVRAAGQTALSRAQAEPHEVRCLNCKTATKSNAEVCRRCGDRLK